MIKKRFFDVNLKLLSTIVQLLASKPEALENKVVKFDVTKILKGKACEIKFIVHKKDNEFVGNICSFMMYPSYIRRIIGHSINIVEDSFLCKAKDTSLRVKPLLITRKKVHRSVRKALRDEARELIKKFVANKTKDIIFKSVISADLQHELSKKLKKIYPLAICEIRVMKVEKEKPKS